ncbi:MAG: helix-turn-helix domain-containing protein [Saprospiraceae bacterium]|nr:helix-turn-helix domain-containing protein [Saprospiraceae bacterium]
MTETITNLSFDTLPSEVAQLKNEVREMKLLIIERINQPNGPEDELFTVDQCAKFLSLSKATIYGLISKGVLPVMRRSKRCYFSKLELIEYLKAGRRKTDSEIEVEAPTYLIKPQKKGRR